jgi:magnesium transporter
VFFVPLIMGAGGNTGTQSAMMIIRSLSTGDLRAQDWVRIVSKELLVGALLGAMLAAALGTWGYFDPHGGPGLALVLGTTMVAVVIWANLVGAVLPLVVGALKLDPTVVSAPMIATLVDVSGMIIYFNVARILIGL